jgi:hypothetical protein
MDVRISQKRATKRRRCREVEGATEASLLLFLLLPSFLAYKDLLLACLLSFPLLPACSKMA